MPDRAVIIGAGMGGLACAARLLQAGVEPLVLEAGERAGGKCGGFLKEGFCVDFAPHVFPTSSASEIAQAARLLGEHLPFVVKDPFALVCLGERRFHLAANPGNLGALMGVALAAGLPLRELLGSAHHFVQLVQGGPDLDPARPRCVQEWVSRYTASRSYHAFLHLFSVLAFVVPYDVADAGELAACFARFAAGPGIGYPLGGCRRLVDTLVQGVRRQGGRILFGHRVERIETDAGAVRAVHAAGQRFEADLVFSNAGIKSTVALTGEGCLDEGYVSRTRALVESMGSLTVTYLLDRQVVEVPAVLVFPDGSGDEICAAIHSGRFIGRADRGCYVVIPSNFDPALAPRGKQILVATTIAPAGLTSDGDLGATIDSLEHGLLRLFPRLQRSIIHRRVTTTQQIAAASGRRTGEAVGVAQIVGQCGGKRPRCTTPVQGLYIVGADTGSGAVGTELAARSGLEAAGLALQRWRG